MIAFKRYTLENGLTVILHEDDSTPLVTVNVLYKIGARNEDPERTGFAHLFEHLMFGGSKNIPDYDTPIQQAGGDNNAFTNADLTNFYNVMPAENLETALWLESDRMLHLDFSQDSLDVQKKVVVEEFKETSINQPYGDMWHELSALAYKEHSYRWPTIGLIPQHIEDAELEDVEAFFNSYYKPNNAVLIVAGQIDTKVTEEKIQKWFGDIPTGQITFRDIPVEPKQEAYRFKSLERAVPSDAIYLGFHMPDRKHKDFIVYDLLSDLLSGGRSARLYENLLKGSELFSMVNAYISGSLDPGLFVVESKLLDEVDIEKAKLMIWSELQKLIDSPISEDELQKVKNSMISGVEFSEVSITNKAINLAYYEMLGDVDLINHQVEEIEAVTIEDIQQVAKEVFRMENCSEVVYRSSNN